MDIHYHGLRRHAEATIAERGGDTNIILHDATLGKVNNLLSGVYTYARQDDMETAHKILAECRPYLNHLESVSLVAQAGYAEAADKVGVLVPPKPQTPEQAERDEEHSQILKALEAHRVLDNHTPLETIDWLAKEASDAKGVLDNIMADIGKRSLPSEEPIWTLDRILAEYDASHPPARADESESTGDEQPEPDDTAELSDPPKKGKKR